MRRVLAVAILYLAALGLLSGFVALVIDDPMLILGLVGGMAIGAAVIWAIAEVSS